MVGEAHTYEMGSDQRFGNCFGEAEHSEPLAVGAIGRERHEGFRRAARIEQRAFKGSKVGGAEARGGVHGIDGHSDDHDAVGRQRLSQIARLLPGGGVENGAIDAGFHQQLDQTGEIAGGAHHFVTGGSPDGA